MIAADMTPERVQIEQLRAELAELRTQAYLRAVTPHVIRDERVECLVEYASELFAVSRSAIVGRTRARDVLVARLAVYWAAKQAFGMSTVAIGRDVGLRDHTTVMSGQRTAKRLRDEDSTFRAATDALVAMFTSGKEQAHARH